MDFSQPRKRTGVVDVNLRKNYMFLDVYDCGRNSSCFDVHRLLNASFKSFRGSFRFNASLMLSIEDPGTLPVA